MIISDGFKEFNSTLTETKNPEKVKFKISQKIVSPVLRALLLEEKFKVFRNPSQSTAEFENFEGGSVDFLKFTEDMSSESKVYTPDARLIIATRVISRRRV